MGLKLRPIEHVRQQRGASFDTDYQVIEECIPNCPACVQQEAAQHAAGEIYRWMQEWMTAYKYGSAFALERDLQKWLVSQGVGIPNERG